MKPDARMFFIGVFFVASITGACSGAGDVSAQTGHLRFAGERIELPLLVEGGHAFVQGDFGDGVSRRLIVDTGSPVNVIDRGIAQAMGLQEKGETEVLSGGTTPVLAAIVTVPRARFGGLEVVDADFLVLELAEMSGGLLQGVLGMQLFAEVLLTIDSGQKKITLSRSALQANGAHVSTFDKSVGQVQTDIDVAGEPIRMNIDSGAPGMFTFPMAASESLPLIGELRQGPVARLVDGERTVYIGTLDGDIQFAGMTYTNPHISFMQPSPPYGNIGNGVLRDLALTIDQRQGLLDIRNSGAVPVATPEDDGRRRRLGVRFKPLPGGGVSTVAGVDAGSIGERAGIKAGDVVIELNGKPIASYDMRALGKLFGGRLPLHLEVERDGERRRIEID